MVGKRGILMINGLSCFEDDVYYKIACEYQAETEMYDRRWTSQRSPVDPTEAFIASPIPRKYSILFARRLRETLCATYNIEWKTVKEVIRSHHYTAQRWIDEYERLQNER